MNMDKILSILSFGVLIFFSEISYSVGSRGGSSSLFPKATLDRSPHPL